MLREHGLLGPWSAYVPVDRVGQIAQLHFGERPTKYRAASPYFRPYTPASPLTAPGTWARPAHKHRVRWQLRLAIEQAQERANVLRIASHNFGKAFRARASAPT